MNASLLILSIASLGGGSEDVLYDFYSKSCVPCQMMMPIVEKLQSEGLPVVKVNVGERPDLAQRFGVRVVPTFVLVVGGQERDRQTGWQDESALRAILAEIPARSAPAHDAADPPPRRRPAKSVPVRLVDDEKSPGFKFRLPIPSFPRKKPDEVEIEPARRASDARLQGVNVEPQRQVPPRDSTAADALAEMSSQTSEADFVPALAASVRIRVRDAAGVNFGSGVVIDSEPGKAIVLTCGHILREVKTNSIVEVDVFLGREPRTYEATIVKFDSEADVGLVAIATPSAVAASSVAPLGEGIRSGDPVVSIGCSDGDRPTVERLRVTTLNRYLGPDTIECTGVPAQGRSGGGLFTTQGRVVGICTNADPRERRGVYAGLKPIHDLLRGAGLQRLVPSASQPEREALADVKCETSAGASADAPGLSRLEAELAQMSHARRDRSTASPQEATVDAQIPPVECAGKALEEAEVICIIRRLHQPQAASRVVIINRASSKFMAYLGGEMKDQIQPTMGTLLLEKAYAEKIEASTVTDDFRAVAERGAPAAREDSGDPNDPPAATADAVSPFTTVSDDDRSGSRERFKDADSSVDGGRRRGQFPSPRDTRVPHRYVRSVRSEP